MSGLISLGRSNLRSKRRGVDGAAAHLDERLGDVQMPDVDVGQQVAEQPAILEDGKARLLRQLRRQHGRHAGGNRCRAASPGWQGRRPAGRAVSAFSLCGALSPAAKAALPAVWARSPQ